MTFTKKCTYIASMYISLFIIASTYAMDPENDKLDLYQAIENDSVTQAQECLEKHPLLYYWTEKTPLHDAISFGCIEIAELLTSHGADVDAKDSSGNTPLHQAAKLNSLALVTCFTNAGANVNAVNNSGETPLHRILCYINTYEVNKTTELYKVISYLIHAGACVTEVIASLPHDSMQNKNKIKYLKHIYIVHCMQQNRIFKSIRDRIANALEGYINEDLTIMPSISELSACEIQLLILNYLGLQKLPHSTRTDIEAHLPWIKQNSLDDEQLNNELLAEQQEFLKVLRS